MPLKASFQKAAQAVNETSCVNWILSYCLEKVLKKESKDWSSPSSSLEVPSDGGGGGGGGGGICVGDRGSSFVTYKNDNYK